MDDDLDKFIFELKWNKSNTIQIFGYSEQVGLFKAIKFYPTLSIEFKYDVYVFHSVVLNMDEDKIFYLDENEQPINNLLSYFKASCLNNLGRDEKIEEWLKEVGML